MSPKLPLLAALLIVLPSVARADLLVQDGQSVAFLGDSITFQGWQVPGGYVKLVTAGFATLGVHIKPVPAGVGGNTSKDMLARVDRDVIAKKPDWMTLSCGVNDVWHGANGVELAPYEANITQIVDKCAAANIKVLIMTATVIGEDLPNPNNQKLVAYNNWLRQFAQQRNLPLAEENGAFQDALKAASSHPAPGFKLTVDGVHPNPDGHQVMATALLQGFGATAAQIAQVQQAWATMPDGAFLNCRAEFAMGPITIEEWNKLKAQAGAHGPVSYQDYGNGLFFGCVRDAFAAHAGDNPPASASAIQSDAQGRFVKLVDAFPSP